MLRRLGLWFDEDWYCSLGCVESEARGRLEEALEPIVPTGSGRRATRLGTLLLHQRSIAPATLSEALRAQRTSGLKLGAQLLAMGEATATGILRALAAQAGIGYLTGLDPAQVITGPGGLSRDAVRALGVVPFEASADRRRLKVACTAPLPRTALAVLRELTGFAVEPLLVDDGLIHPLVAAYASRPADTRAELVRTTTLREAAHRIAEAARSGRARRMQQVRCSPYIWVRLEGDATTQELVLPLEALRKERTCRVAPMSH